MSANLYTNQESNVFKTWVLMSVFFVVIIALGWYASWYFDSTIVLYGAVIFSIGMNIFSYWFSDKVVIKITGAKLADENQYRDLHNLVENLAITAGLPKPKVYVINDPAPNAFATGRNKNHSAVAFTTGILETLNRSELEGVVAHELAHVGNKDILLQTIIVVLVGFITLIADMLLRSSIYGEGGGNRDNKGHAILLVVGIILVILSPVIATLIQLAISRKREFLADATGALLTRYPEGLASALEKIEMHSGKMKKANHATAHLFISDPYGEKTQVKKISFFHKIFLTHPPIQERTSALRGLSIK
jgi:heat shock protein HtpX